MRPTELEALRAVQAGLAEDIAPELVSLYAQDRQRTVQMLLESLAAGADSAAQDLVDDIAGLERLLDSARSALTSFADGNEDATLVVKDIDGVRGGPKSESLNLSVLSARHTGLSAVFERVLVFVEAGGQDGDLAPLRKEMYAHLRHVATRGWSFWDMASFRGRMEEIRAAQGG